MAQQNRRWTIAIFAPRKSMLSAHAYCNRAGPCRGGVALQSVEGPHAARRGHIPARLLGPMVDCRRLGDRRIRWNLIRRTVISTPAFRVPKSTASSSSPVLIRRVGSGGEPDTPTSSTLRCVHSVRSAAWVRYRAEDRTPLTRRAAVSRNRRSRRRSRSAPSIWREVDHGGTSTLRRRGRTTL